jgi:hypothetical protein
MHPPVSEKVGLVISTKPSAGGVIMRHAGYKKVTKVTRTGKSARKGRGKSRGSSRGKSRGSSRGSSRGGKKSK